MECPGCHHHNPAEASYCSGCGAALPSPGDLSTREIPSSSKNLVVGSILAGKYRITQEVGKGGMGVVYRGEDLKLKRAVALKFLPPWLTWQDAAKDRFIQEARAASVLVHSNVCTIFEIDETDDGQMFIVMSYCEGETLKEKLERGPLAVEQALDVAIQVCEGLAAAHAAGIVHRDIKPANIMVSDRGCVKIVDFGLAKLAGQTRVTIPGTVMGTAAYMSPEQAEGGEVDHRTDIWSLGVVVYEMLTGRLPFRGEDAQAVIHSILSERPAPVSAPPIRVRADLERVLMTCLEKNPARRYGTALELSAALKRVRSKVPRKRSRSRLKLIETICTVIGAVAAAYTLYALLPPGWPHRTASAIKVVLGNPDFPASRYVAILPFEPAGSSGGRPLCDGLVEICSRELARIAPLADSFWVVPALDIARDTITTVGEARDRLGVDLVLTGKIATSADLVTVSLDLVNAATKVPLKHSSVSDPLANLSTWQDSLVVRMARMLDVSLPATAYAPLKVGSTSVPEAFGAFARGRGYLYPFGAEAQLDSAEVAFNQAIAADASFARAYVGLGETYLLRFRSAVAKDTLLIRKVFGCCDQAIKVCDRLPSSYVLRGMGEVQMHRYDDAVANFWQAARLDSAYFEAFEEMAVTYYWMGSYDLALAAAKKMVALRPKSYAAQDWLATVYRVGQDNDKVARHARAMVRLRPDKARGYASLGVALCNMDSLSAAGAMLEKALALQPRAYDVCSNLGTIYFWQARYADAARMYEQAMSLSDNSRNDYLTLAHYAEALYWTPGRRDKAHAFFEAAISLAEKQLGTNPGGVALILNLASYESMLGDRPKALAYLDQALRLHPSAPDESFRVAETYEQLGDRDNALVWIEKALASGYPPAHLDRYPGIRDLRSDERFRRLRPQT